MHCGRVKAVPRLSQHNQLTLVPSVPAYHAAAGDDGYNGLRAKASGHIPLTRREMLAAAHEVKLAAALAQLEEEERSILRILEDACKDGEGCWPLQRSHVAALLCLEEQQPLAAAVAAA